MKRTFQDVQNEQNGNKVSQVDHNALHVYTGFEIIVHGSLGQAFAYKELECVAQCNAIIVIRKIFVVVEEVELNK